MVRALLGGAVVVAIAGCARNTGSLIRSGEEVPDGRIAGLYPCEEGRAPVVDLDPSKPLTLLVHGCTSSGARFKTLSRVFEAQGQQTLCFNYNDRDYLNTSATQLAEALSALQSRLAPHELTILGHSQGGLVARRALQGDLPRPLQTRAGFSYRLVTVSSPFAGITSSADCAKTWLHLVTLSTTVFVCLAITGNKWLEIPPGSTFMENATPLVATRHLQIVTDERGTCRTQRPDGTCAVDDFVFAREEQYSNVVAESATLTTVELKQGHSAVVGENGSLPTLLITTLQAQGVLASSPTRSAESLAALWSR